MGNLGILLHEQGDLAGAKAAYQQAIDSGYPGHIPEAAVLLGTLLEQQGDVAAARTAYRRAIGSGHRAADIARQRLRALRRAPG
jgi:Flp pilus assembly protein TadD